MKNTTLKGFKGTPKDFTKILYEGWWNHRRKIIRKLEGEMYCNILETIQPPEIRERLLNPSLDIDDPTFNFGNLQLKGFRGEEGQGYEIICDDNHWDRAFRIPDRKLIGMCSESVFCLSENSKGLTLPKQNLKTIISSRDQKNKFKKAYKIPTSKTIYRYKIERGNLKYRLFWIIEPSNKCVDIFEFRSRKEMGRILGYKD